ncbi:type II secretion system F family protein [Desmospora profundinema]|uniref:Tight adherence protein B n=1 Tax=Desmospora profundinema TaxID=1571184 RepID=A0ABU1IQM3_9BACL|nr:type II secretion system F family protein [Desmospora profundinema]MDR6227070.1 tight adherence protein B [Desmospora profundinema]
MTIAILGAASVFSLFMVLFYALQYRTVKKQTHETMGEKTSVIAEERFSEQLAQKIDQQQWAKRLEPQLKRASLKIRPSEYGALLLAVGLFLFFLLYYWLEAPLWLGIVVATSLTPIGSRLFLASRKFIYVNKINNQLSETCRLLSSAARAGLSIPQGLELVMQELPSPIKDEVAIVVRESRLGRDLEHSLNDMLTRVYSRDLQVFINALIIQRRAGGDLATVLNEMANTMEERKIINKTIDASIAQARYSAYLLPLISLLIVIMMSQMIEGFFDFFTSIFGLIVLVVFIFMQVLAFFLIKKIADIRF